MSIDLKALFANAPQDQKDFLQFQADNHLLSLKCVELIQRYPGQYAGAYNGEIKIATTPGELFALFGENAKRAAWLYLSIKPINLFLAA